ncbi:concanavalin A-like lectin/glucanase domain-containing protein [Lipomyces japonicus]|uniref:concanavalin A-like lectin/glucanase domain-containing protein n=1 Tax=Lipomyces japonicus TaxID=56871 RepID=UPI0034CF91AB
MSGYMFAPARAAESSPLPVVDETPDPNDEEYFVPEYLSGTCYADLVANYQTHLSRSIAQPSAPLTTPGKPYSGGVELNNIFADHHGINLAASDKPPPRLPTLWNSLDKSNILELVNDGLDVRFYGSVTKSADQDAASVRANYPIPPECGLFYFEVEVLSKGKDGFIGIGFCGPKVALNKMPGWVQESWGYHGDDGNSFACQNTGKLYGPQFSTRDVIGCGVNFRNGTAFYTKNGISLDVAFKDVKGTLYPAVGMRTIGEHVRANFGQKPFIFDIDSYMVEEKIAVYKQISSFPPPLDILGFNKRTSADAAITHVIHKLISSYLAHNGYVDSVRAFTDDVQKETNAFKTALSSSGTSLTSITTAEENIEAANRQLIRSAILEGNIDRALKLTNTFYPTVFEQNPHILFQLQCRRFVELIGKYALLSAADTEMQGNDASSDVNDDDRVTSDQILTEALQYGQQLSDTYRSNGSPEIQKSLQEIFALMAYPKPLESPVAHLLAEEGRSPVAEDLNSAILVSLGKSSVAPLERLIQHTTMLVRELAEKGGPSAFVNVRHDFL